MDECDSNALREEIKVIKIIKIRFCVIGFVDGCPEDYLNYENTMASATTTKPGYQVEKCCDTSSP